MWCQQQIGKIMTMRYSGQNNLFYDKFHKESSIQAKVISKDNFTYRNAIKLFGENIKKTSGLKILDFGCGVGTLSLYFAACNNNVIGVDVSKRAISLARRSAKRMGIDSFTEFEVLSEWKHLLYKNKFDVAVSIEVIEHVSDDAEVLSILFSCIRHGGKLILSTPSVNAPLYKLGLVEEFDKRVGHLRRYSINELVKKMKSAGFKVEEVRRTEGVVRNSLFLFPLLGKFVRFIKGPISGIVTFIDNITIPLFGESNLYVVATKI